MSSRSKNKAYLFILAATSKRT